MQIGKLLERVLYNHQTHFLLELNINTHSVAQ
jgi:hypothetical protein